MCGRYDGDWGERLEHFFRIRGDQLQIIERGSGRRLHAAFPTIATVRGWIDGGLLLPTDGKPKPRPRPCPQTAHYFLGSFLGSTLGVFFGWIVLTWALRHRWVKP